MNRLVFFILKLSQASAKLASFLEVLQSCQVHN